MAVRLARKPERPWHMRRMRPPSSGAAPRLPPAADGRRRGGRGAARLYRSLVWRREGDVW